MTDLIEKVQVTTPTKEELVIQSEKAWREARGPGVNMDRFEEYWLAQRLADALAEVERLRAEYNDRKSVV